VSFTSLIALVLIAGVVGLYETFQWIIHRLL
jgi:hypothetical protein